MKPYEATSYEMIKFSASERIGSQGRAMGFGCTYEQSVMTERLCGALARRSGRKIAVQCQWHG